jgi:hypothetical protein
MNKIIEKRKNHPIRWTKHTRQKKKKKKQNWNFHFSWKKNHKRWIRSGLTINVKKWPSEPVAG